MKHNLIGLLIMIIGIPLAALGLPFLGAPLIFVGVFLFVGSFTNQVFSDYVIIDPQTGQSTDDLLIRQRLYFETLPITLTIMLFTLGIGQPKFVYKVNYFRVPLAELQKDTVTLTNDMTLSRAEYRALLEQQRTLYAAGNAPDEIVADICSPQAVAYGTIKARYIAALVLTILSLLGTVVCPFDGMIAMLPLMLAATVLLGWWLVLKRFDLKDAEIKQAAYVQYAAKQSQNKMEQ